MAGPRLALLGGYTALGVYSLTQDYVVADQATAVLLALYCAVATSAGGQSD